MKCEKCNKEAKPKEQDYDITRTIVFCPKCNHPNDKPLN